MLCISNKTRFYLYNIERVHYDVRNSFKPQGSDRCLAEKHNPVCVSTSQEVKYFHVNNLKTAVSETNIILFMTMTCPWKKTHFPRPFFFLFPFHRLFPPPPLVCHFPCHRYSARSVTRATETQVPAVSPRTRTSWISHTQYTIYTTNFRDWTQRFPAVVVLSHCHGCDGEGEWGIGHVVRDVITVQPSVQHEQ